MSKVLKEEYRRNIKTCGLSMSIVLDSEGNRIMPVKVVRSRSGAHGEDIYVINSVVYILRYRRSNSGKVRWAVFAVTPEKEVRVLFRDLSESLQSRFREEAGKEGLELFEFEEEEEKIFSDILIIK
ncbi:MAG: hypothetical protein QXN35_07240 [Ignisphaera sp.]